MEKSTGGNRRCGAVAKQANGWARRLPIIGASRVVHVSSRGRHPAVPAEARVRAFQLVRRLTLAPPFDGRSGTGPLSSRPGAAMRAGRGPDRWSKILPLGLTAPVSRGRAEPQAPAVVAAAGRPVAAAAGVGAQQIAKSGWRPGYACCTPTCTWSRQAL
jgi:hypothetical protein